MASAQAGKIQIPSPARVHVDPPPGILPGSNKASHDLVVGAPDLLGDPNGSADEKLVLDFWSSGYTHSKNGPTGRQSRTDLVRRIVSSHNLELVPCEPDGNCFFYGVRRHLGIHFEQVPK